MFHTPGYQHNLSLRLSKALDDIGVNEATVIKRRRAILLLETMQTVTFTYTDRLSIYMFGSLSEGTTTGGLHSDADTLYCSHSFNVIQDFAEWKPGFTNLLMIQDNTTSPGYCLLQLIRNDEPLPATNVPNKHYVRDMNARVLLKNTLFRDAVLADVVQHGPSWVIQGTPGIADLDTVPAFPCNSWPHETRAWLDRRGMGRWPTANMKRFAANTGCFVVPVGSKVSQYPELEWRISTSLAERCLMFNLNITQIRCYVLMKMILKTYLDHAGEGHISSFMCKTVLLHCIENTHLNAWQENSLLTCLSCCLHVLYNCLQQENCPHFITPGNNLMRGQFSPEDMRLLRTRLFYLIQTDRQAMLGVKIDDLGQRLQIKLNMIYQLPENTPSKREMGLIVSGGLLRDTARVITTCNREFLSETIHSSSLTTVHNMLKLFENVARCYREGSRLEQRASSLLAPLFCSTVGTVMVSLSIETNNTIPPEALVLLSAGLNSDVSSGRLKLASVFYSLGNMVETEHVLKYTERCYGIHDVEPICDCYDTKKPLVLKSFKDVAYYKNEEAVRNVCAFCTKFIPAEIRCVPRELQYELFRSTEDDLRYRERTDSWMDWAVVDSLPYLYFLQYKTYGHLQRFDDQHQALANLIRSIEEQPNLSHRETALNLLGQCMEQENQPNKALLCYTISLKVRERNNAARFHICRPLENLKRERMR